MSNRRFRISKERFLDWMYSDSDDVLELGQLVLTKLKEEYSTYFSVKQIFENRESLPGHLFKEQFTEQEIEDLEHHEEIPISEILLERFK